MLNYSVAELRVTLHQWHKGSLKMGKITAHLKNILDVTTFYTGNMFLCHKINIQ